MKRATTSKEFREQIAWRNSYKSVGSLGIPLVRKQPLVEGTVDLISYSDIKMHDKSENTKKGVHYYIDDPRFFRMYDNPDLSFERLSQYAFLLTPDYSLYSEMEPWQQIESIGKSRWLGAYWQERGMTVYPTVSWGLPRTWAFCFEGIEYNAPVSIGMIGCKHFKMDYLRGYTAMLDKLNPSEIICFGTPFPEMEGITVAVDYAASRKVVR